jgi:hypothetical protein
MTDGVKSARIFGAEKLSTGTITLLRAFGVVSTNGVVSSFGVMPVVRGVGDILSTVGVVGLITLESTIGVIGIVPVVWVVGVITLVSTVGVR